MAMVVKVRFKRASKLYDFDPNGFELHTGMYVVTETARGVELGECMSGVYGYDDELLAAPLKPIIRIATEQDLKTQKDNEQAEKEAFDIAVEKIAEHELEMKLVDVEYAFDHSKIIFYFTANGRVDFRMLVKNLAGIFKTRIELRQIGVRDEAKMLGGIGPCGRPICCRTFLSDFTPVSIKMAKEQNLSLNPTKISGLCDRLMCCLKYEQDHYEVTRKRMPRVGREIITPDGAGTINAINVLEETVRVRIAVGDSFELREYPIDECQRPGQEQNARPERAQEKREEAPAPKAQAQSEQPDKPENPETAEKNEKIEKNGENAPRAPKAERFEKPRRNDRGPRPERAPKPERPEKSESQPRAERTPKGERAEKPRQDKPQKGDGQNKNERGPRPERPAKQDRPPKRDAAQAPKAAEKPAEASVIDIREESSLQDLL